MALVPATGSIVEAVAQAIPNRRSARLARARFESVHRAATAAQKARGTPLGFQADEMDGGHYVTLSRPRELARRLDAYAARLRDSHL